MNIIQLFPKKTLLEEILEDSPDLQKDQKEVVAGIISAFTNAFGTPCKVIPLFPVPKGMDAIAASFKINLDGWLDE